MANPGDYKISQLNPAGTAWPDRIAATLPGGGGVGGTGDSTQLPVTLAAHGFSVKEALFHNGTTWVRAKADAFGTARVDGVVESVGSANAFVLVTGGAFTDSVGGWATNTQYYLSHITAGLLVNTPPPFPSTNFQVEVLRTGPAAEATIEIGQPLSLAQIPNSALAPDAAKALIATQAMAEAGLNNTDTMTPFRTAQAIAALAPAGGGGSGVTLSAPAYAATINVDASTGTGGGMLIVQVGALTGNVTLANPTNPTNRQRIEYVLKQDATGNRTLTLGNKFRFPSSSSLTSPISSTNSIEFSAASRKTRLLVEYDLSDDKWDAVSFVAGY